MFLVLQAKSHLKTTLRIALLVLKALSLQQVPQVARHAKLELRQIKTEVLVLLAKLELLQGRPSRSVAIVCVHLCETISVRSR